MIDVDLTARVFLSCGATSPAPAVISLFSVPPSDNKSRIPAARIGLPLIFSCKEQQKQRAGRVGT
jgi:hypothetical protein